MTALNLFGVGVGLVGTAGASVATQASREVLAMPRGGRWPILAGLGFVLLADLLVAATGAALAIIRI